MNKINFNKHYKKNTINLFSILGKLIIGIFFLNLFVSTNSSQTKASYDPNLSIKEEFYNLQGNSFFKAYDLIYQNQTDAYVDWDYSNALANRINQYRMELGKAPYYTPRNLQAISRIKAQDVIEQDYFGHNNPQGRDFFENMGKIGYKYYTEIILMNYYVGVERDFNAWKDSYVHNQVMISSMYNSMGVVCVFFNSGRWHQCITSVAFMDTQASYGVANEFTSANFVKPKNESSTSNFKTDISLKIKANNSLFANKDAFIWLVSANTSDINNKNALYNMDQGQKVRLKGESDEIDLTFKDVNLPYSGDNYFYCYVSIPESDSVPSLCGGAEPNVLKIKYTGKEEPIYRFWNDKNKGHFYTSNPTEKKHVENSNSIYHWDYEGISFDANGKDAKGNCEIKGVIPVHRFWSEEYAGHFYTTDEAEKNFIIKKYPEKTWKYEGFDFCASTEKTSDTKPVFRFWSDLYKRHFYTIDEGEKDFVIKNNPKEVWNYEGIAYYAMD